MRNTVRMVYIITLSSTMEFMTSFLLPVCLLCRLRSSARARVCVCVYACLSALFIFLNESMQLRDGRLIDLKTIYFTLLRRNNRLNDHFDVCNRRNFMLRRNNLLLKA